MPGPARKLLISATPDGLVIQPLTTKGQTTRPVAIKYGDATVSTVSRDRAPSPDPAAPNASFEAFGIIGLFTVARLSYLISITGRSQVALIRGHPVYVVTDVAITPCTSLNEAETAVRHTAAKIGRDASSSEKPAAEVASETESDTEQLHSSVEAEDIEDPGAQSDRESSDNARENIGEESGIAQDVFKKRTSYGRFAQKWFSNKGWMASRRRRLGLSVVAAALAVDGKDNETDSSSKKDTSEDEAPSRSVSQERTADLPPGPTAGESLTPKLLRMAQIWFGTSNSFFFSYDMDITRSVVGQTTPHIPLHKAADPTYFWNQHLLKPFLALGDEALLLPIMQGFVGQRSFSVDRHPQQPYSPTEPTDSVKDAAQPPKEPLETREYLITLISRRSINRAGLRYLRRGIDEQGSTANCVETEQILSTPTWDPSSKIHAFTQLRGSIPLFFTQSPYSLKPVPVLQHSPEANFRAFARHFGDIGAKYGAVQVVNLVEQHGVEAMIGNEYRKNVEKYNAEIPEGGRTVGFEWFDFHSACRGMKFENVSQLLDKLGASIEAAGSTVEVNGLVVQRQDGVLRTNCMDCLDRTNVCQSSFGKFLLDLQVREEGFDMAAQADRECAWFNTLWADNGDAISKQYASTAAMKGDYTRTRKRDYMGVVNDLGLSLTRFYNGMVNDHFSQAAIDFFLGNVTSLVFDEFEATMMTKDPGVSTSRMRELAIETSQKIAIEDDNEDFMGGWTLLSPHVSDTIKSSPFEEVVLLLTDVAIYLCRFDWKLDKVSSFERVDLAHIVGIQVGTYITSTISPAHADEAKNVGLVITYEPGKTDVKRTNTGSLSSRPGARSSVLLGPNGQGILSTITGSKSASETGQRKIALKALYAHTAISEAQGVKPLTEVEQVDIIVAEIERLARANQPPPPDNGDENKGKEFIRRADIISLEEAKRTTGLFEQLGHTIMKLVWA